MSAGFWSVRGPTFWLKIICSYPRSGFLAQTFWSSPVRLMVRSLKSVSKLCWYGPVRSRFFFQKRYFRIEPVIVQLNWSVFGPVRIFRNWIFGPKLLRTALFDQKLVRKFWLIFENKNSIGVRTHSDWSIWILSIRVSRSVWYR